MLRRAARDCAELSYAGPERAKRRSTPLRKRGKHQQREDRAAKPATKRKGPSPWMQGKGPEAPAKDYGISDRQWLPSPAGEGEYPVGGLSGGSGASPDVACCSATRVVRRALRTACRLLQGADAAKKATTTRNSTPPSKFVDKRWSNLSTKTPPSQTGEGGEGNKHPGKRSSASSQRSAATRPPHSTAEPGHAGPQHQQRSAEASRACTVLTNYPTFCQQMRGNQPQQPQQCPRNSTCDATHSALAASPATPPAASATTRYAPQPRSAAY